MIQAIQKKLKNKKGFTLIELIVVIAILGIIAAIAVPRFMGMQANARARADEANIRQIRNAVELFRAEHNDTWPTEANFATDIDEYLPTIPAPQVANHHYYYNEATGTVTDATAAPDGATQIR